VPESRVLKLMDNNLQKTTSNNLLEDCWSTAEEPGTGSPRQLGEPPILGSLRKTRKNKQKTPGNGDGGSASKAPQPPQKKERKKERKGTKEGKKERKKENRMEVKVKIPEELKSWFVQDWDLVTRKQLFQLPAKENADAILEEYANCKKLQGNVGNKEYVVNEVVARIKEYFNVMLGIQLLHKFGRPHYEEILLACPDMPMSQVQGALHLQRLFVKIGAMLAYRPLDEKTLALLLGYSHDFLKYLPRNATSLFTASDYKVASPPQSPVRVY
uniref:MRG domain-containing protein n=1 Tax=Mustela putorius furo TaxID=9669 RepID=M3YJ04_MUSPF